MINILDTINVQDHILNIYGTEEEPLFLAVDVARMIDFSVGHTSHMLSNVDPDEKRLINTRRPNASIGRGNPEKWFLTEHGLYEVLMQSRKPVARRFKRAVKEMLKEIRLKNENSSFSELEDWMNHADPLVDEWEGYCRVTGEDMSYSDWLMEYKGYTQDML